MICIIGQEQTAQLNNKQRWCLTVLFIAVSTALEQGLVHNRRPECYSLCPEPPLPTPCDHHGHMASLALRSSLCSKVSSSDKHRLTVLFIYLLIFISFRCTWLCTLESPYSSSLSHSTLPDIIHPSICFSLMVWIGIIFVHCNNHSLSNNIRHIVNTQ